VRALTVVPQQANPIALEERDAPSGEGDLLIAAVPAARTTSRPSLILR
jgi:hypothetical protein